MTDVILALLIAGVLGLLAHHAAEVGTPATERALAMIGFGVAVACAILLSLSAWLASDRDVLRLGISTVLFAVSFVFVAAGAAERQSPVAAITLVLAVLVALPARSSNARQLVRRMTPAAAVAVLARATELVQVTDGPLAVARVAGDVACIVLVLLVVVPFTLRTLAALWEQNEEWQSQLAEAEAAAELTARRDHEIRNLLVGLTGAAGALGSRIDSPTGRHLHAVASSELERLRHLLDGGGGGGTAGRSPMSPAPVTDVLRDLAAVHRAGGATVTVRAPESLLARVDARSLSQIVTNLLVNCARHAPGAPVELRASRCADRVRVEVVDSGRGLPPGLDPATLLEKGTCLGAGAGQGLGLHISADLVHRHGGHLWIGPARPGPGCAVVIDLPAVLVPTAVA